MKLFELFGPSRAEKSKETWVKELQAKRKAREEADKRAKSMGSMAGLSGYTERNLAGAQRKPVAKPQERQAVNPYTHG